MTNFRAGSTTPLTKSDIIDAGHNYGIDPALLAAFMRVEAGYTLDGRLHGFFQNMEIKLRFEKHRVAQYATKDQVRELEQNGLVTQRWTQGQRGGPSIFKKAHSIAPHASLMATSFGLTQIMGFNHYDAGFATPEDMVNYMSQSERHQLNANMVLMRKWGVIEQARKGSYAGMARIWNGPRYAENNYDTKLRRFHIRFGSVFGGSNSRRVELTLNHGMIKMGDRGNEVKKLQTDLVALGAEMKVDGDFGPTTLRFVKAFQHANGLNTDGMVGPATLQAIEERTKTLASNEKENSNA